MPQMPDTRIPLSGLGGGGGQASSIFGTLGGLMQIKEQQQQAEIRRRALEDDQATRDALSQSERPDDAVQTLWKQGRSSAAANLAKSVYDDRKAKADEMDAQLITTSKRLEQAGQIMHGVTDERSFQVARPAIGALLEPVFGKNVYDQIGTSYDPARKQALIDWGTNRVNQINADHQSIQEQQNAWRIGLEPDEKTGQWSPEGLQAQQAYRSALSRRLSTAQNQQQWDYYLQLAHNNGTPTAIIKEMGPWTPDAPDRAYLLGMTSAQEATASIGQQRAETAADREARLAAGGGGGITDAARRAEGTKRDEENQSIDKWVRGVFEDDNPPEFLKNPDGTYVKDAKGKRKTKPKPFRVEDLSEDHQNEFVQRRLQNENNYRRQVGMPPLEEAAKAAADRGDVAGYQKVQGIYNSLTQGLQKLEDKVPPPQGSASPTSQPATSQPNTATPTRGAATDKGQTALSPMDRRTRVDAIRRQLETERDPRKRLELFREVGSLVNFR